MGQRRHFFALVMRRLSRAFWSDERVTCLRVFTTAIIDQNRKQILWLDSNPG
jgi:hypothetical protein